MDMQPRSLPTYRYKSTRCYVANSYIGKSVHLLLGQTTYNTLTMLLAGSLVAQFLRFQAYLLATSWVHYTTSCNTQSSAPEDGRVHRSKHVELIGIINKPLLLRLVGVYIIYNTVSLWNRKIGFLISATGNFFNFLFYT